MTCSRIQIGITVAALMIGALPAVVLAQDSRVAQAPGKEHVPGGVENRPSPPGLLAPDRSPRAATPTSPMPRPMAPPSAGSSSSSSAGAPADPVEKQAPTKKDTTKKF